MVHFTASYVSFRVGIGNSSAKNSECVSVTPWTKASCWVQIKDHIQSQLWTVDLGVLEPKNIRLPPWSLTWQNGGKGRRSGFLLGETVTFQGLLYVKLPGGMAFDFFWTTLDSKLAFQICPTALSRTPWVPLGGYTNWAVKWSTLKALGFGDRETHLKTSQNWRIYLKTGDPKHPWNRAFSMMISPTTTTAAGRIGKFCIILR